VFLLSPASSSGERARFLFNERARFDLAQRVQAGGAPLGEVFSFLSGLYFRGKLTYALTFADPPRGVDGVLVITPSEGLLRPDEAVDLARLRGFAAVPIDVRDRRYLEPLVRDATLLDAKAGPRTEVVLLGSVASGKYVEPLAAIFGERLLFPADFVGRGDMSRGGLLLRGAADGQELRYVPVAGATLHGARPPKLAPRPGILRRALGRAAATSRRDPR
jgi:hypothetical protein